MNPSLNKLTQSLEDYHITYLQGFFLIGETELEYNQLIHTKLGFIKVMPRIYLSTLYYLSSYTDTVVFVGRHSYHDKSMMEITLIGTPRRNELFLDLWKRIFECVEKSIKSNIKSKPIHLHERAYSSILRKNCIENINDTLIKLLDLKKNMPIKADLSLYKTNVKDYIKNALPSKKLKRRLYAPRTR